MGEKVLKKYLIADDVLVTQISLPKEERNHELIKNCNFYVRNANKKSFQTGVPIRYLINEKGLRVGFRDANGVDHVTAER